MHGRPRKALEPVDAAAQSAKTEKLRLLQSQFLANHHNRIYSKEALEISVRLLEINPESYTAWNYRKLAVEHLVSQSESNPDTIKSIFDEELKVVESALRQNFKSYGAWHHRKWVLSKGYSSIDNELRLLDRFQKADPRNFHAWNYRRFVCALMKRSDEDELNYTEKMIGTNFSNYSAWHNRSVLLSNLMKREVEGHFPKEKVLEEEYNLVQNALFTDPDDQSGWFYHLWLIDQTVKSDAPVLVSSWPFPGSHITLKGNKCLHDHGSSISYPSLLDTGIIPLILCFNQAVEGIESSTVAVKSELGIVEDLIWKSLSTNSLNTAQVWVTYLNLRNLKLQMSRSYLIEISIGHSEGIMSSSGYHYSRPSEISFKLFVETAFTEPAEDQVGKMISWENDNFQKIEHFQEADFIMSDRIITGNDYIPAISNWCAETIGNEINSFRVLLSESDCKIGKLTLARLLTAYDSISSAHDKGMVHSEEILELYADLLKFDPTHSSYYKDERSLVLLRQITSTRESLLQYCHHDRNSIETNDGYVCLRLQNLSLSRMGSIESLLWVQMLDLGHNELKSIEGLEAMQLLACLNLGHNKIGTFTALGPLRLLKSLKVLNITHNEIGSRSVDTTRYLCSSPLSHTEEFDCDLFESLSGDVSAPSMWEAFLVFKSLNLKQLDITGNAFAGDNKIRSFLVKLLPTLKWLDGEALP
ncbi:geranylgeranyl transferase type-2 subunit alpha 1 isoform X2 [Neltuma alba]|uniref:geranylgeranyl transferase type-2 subunit alpha 1 isoform X2 n=1 Tax=Neltuma alba TaxID=207710 RepID=UPI0010A3F7C8|nr:geranylgeranyl transferase type-2 subunit alpha 1 isoform X2 [Prosopis alba]